MNHTTYYQLSLWEQDDRIMREDFNDNNTKIDAALAEKPFVIGTYTGDGKTEVDGGQQVNLGFQPRFVIAGTAGNNCGLAYRSGMITSTASMFSGYLNADGFVVYHTDTDQADVNNDSRTYYYIAFR